MKSLTKALGALAILILSFSPAFAGFSLTIGSGDYYSSVGDYDYLPYTMEYGGYSEPQINFYDVMSDYGTWVSVSPFGRVWRPYVSYSWRPFTQGHWIYTEYGPTWAGYEPWAWAAYHYGNWVWTPQFSWVWIPGYEW